MSTADREMPDRERRRHCPLHAFILLAPVLLAAAGCGLFDTAEGSFFDFSALSSGYVLYSTYDQGGSEADLSLYTVQIDPLSFQLLYSADLDLGAPSIASTGTGGWKIGFGLSDLTVIDAFSRRLTPITVTGGTGRYVALDPTGTDRLVYMSGSTAGGFNIVARSSPSAADVMLTNDASASVSNLTPAWSWNGQWILYAKVSGATGQLWRVHFDGSGAEQLPITTTELPTNAVFSPNGLEVLVPGDFTSYKISDGTVGTIDHVRNLDSIKSKLATMGYEWVGSPITGPVHEGDLTAGIRHTFPMSVCWSPALSSKIIFEALVANSSGDPPHQIAGLALFIWTPGSQSLVRLTNPILVSEEATEGYSLSIMRPTIVP
jgi:hypothetical protein